MARNDFIGGGRGIILEDVGGSFARLREESPKIYRQVVYDALDKTRFALEQRMRSMAPVGPDSPHIREAITSKRRGYTAQVGYIDATDFAGPDNDASLADVALYNEYNPNRQPFMRPAAELEAKDFVTRIMKACRDVEHSLSGGGGLL
jgi:hypothetical protein